MTQMTAKRPKIQIDASADLANAIKSLAYAKGLTMRQFVMFSLAEKYPELKDLVRAEIELPGPKD